MRETAKLGGGLGSAGGRLLDQFWKIEDPKMDCSIRCDASGFMEVDIEGEDAKLFPKSGIDIATKENGEYIRETKKEEYKKFKESKNFRYC